MSENTFLDKHPEFKDKDFQVDCSDLFKDTKTQKLVQQVVDRVRTKVVTIVEEVLAKYYIRADLPFFKCYLTKKEVYDAIEKLRDKNATDNWNGNLYSEDLKEELRLNDEKDNDTVNIITSN